MTTIGIEIATAGMTTAGTTIVVDGHCPRPDMARMTVRGYDWLGWVRRGGRRWSLQNFSWRTGAPKGLQAHARQIGGRDPLRSQHRLNVRTNFG